MVLYGFSVFAFVKTQACIRGLDARRAAIVSVIGMRLTFPFFVCQNADLHKRSAARDREILKTLNRFFGGAILHEITPHRLEQFKRDRLTGTWRAFKQKRSANPVKPGTVMPSLVVRATIAWRPRRRWLMTRRR